MECFSSSASVIDLSTNGPIANNIARINIFSTGSLVNIPPVSMDVANDQDDDSILNVFVTSEFVQSSAAPIINLGGNDFGGLILPAEDEHKVRFACGLAGNLTGTVRVGQIRRLQVDGSIGTSQSACEVVGGFAYGTNGYSIGYVLAGSIAATASITAGNKFQDLSITGNVAGTVETLVGDIDNIDIDGAVNGNIEVARNIIRTDVGGEVGGSITTAATSTSRAAEFLKLANVTGYVRLGRITAATPNTSAVEVTSNTNGEVHTLGIVGSVLIQSQTGSTNSGVFVHGDVFGNIAANQVDNLVVDGSVAGNITGVNIGTVHITQNLSGFDVAIGQLVQADTIGTLRVDGDLTGSFQRRQIRVNEIGTLHVGGNFAAIVKANSAIFLPDEPSQVSNIFIGGDLLDVHEPPESGQVWLTGLQSMTVLGNIQRSEGGSGPGQRIRFSELSSTSTVTVGRRIAADIEVGDLATFASSFSGQIYVNALLCDSSATVAWQPNARFFVEQSPISVMPFYTPRSNQLGQGTGYLAVLPFGLYESMCTPVDGAIGTITSSAFNRENDDNCTQDTPVKLHFYGPIAIGNPAVPAAKVELLTGNGPVDMSRRVTFRVDMTLPPEQRRDLIIEGKPGYPIPYGTYRVTNSESPYQALYCVPIAGVGTPCASWAFVSPFEYHFELLPDCIAPYCEAEEDPSDCPTLPDYWCDPIDFNNDTSLFDPQDIDAFLSIYSEGPGIPATAICNDWDFNNDGSGQDPCDIDAFLLAWSEGPCTACGM